MIKLELLIQIVVGIIVIGGGIVSFFVMQKGQNMKIEQLEKDITDLTRKLSDYTGRQIQTEKAIVEINATLKHIAEAIDELKKL